MADICNKCGKVLTQIHQELMKPIEELLCEECDEEPKDLNTLILS